MRFPEFWSSTFWRRGGAHRTPQQTSALDNAFALIDGPPAQITAYPSEKLSRDPLSVRALLREVNTCPRARGAPGIKSGTSLT